MLRQSLSFIAFLVFILSLSPVVAEQTFSMDDITKSLQTDYQRHLKPKKKIKKVQPKRKVAIPHTKKRAQVSLRLPSPKVRRQTPVPVPRVLSVPKAGSLFSAAKNGNVPLIGQLLRQGANINSANRERETALHMAAANGKYSAVIYLVSHGANLHARTIKNWLAIHHATRFRHADIANYLKQRGASPHARTSDGLSAIDMARSMGDRRLMGVFGVR